MSRSIPRLTAAALLAISGITIAVMAFAIVVAKAVIATGLPGVHIRPSDVALLDDLVPILPFVATYAAVNLVAALALTFGRSWADRIATAVATVAVSFGSFAFVLVALGHDPFSSRSTIAAAGDGLGIIAAAIAFYGAVLVALAIAGDAEEGSPAPERRSLPAFA